MEYIQKKITKKTRIIVGIDPGYDRLGICVISKSNGEKEQLIFSDCFTSSKKDSEGERIFSIGKKILSVLETYTPDEVALEKLFFMNNKNTGIATAHICGIIKYMTHDMGIYFYEYAPTQVKLAIAGHGFADKENVHMMVQRLIVLPEKKRYDDEIDAIAIALTHTAHIK